MKMKGIDRILLGLYAFFGAIVLIFSGLDVLGVQFDIQERIAETLNYYLWEANGLWGKGLVLALLLVLIVWSVHLVALAFQHERRKDRGSVSIQNTGDGAVRISVQAMDALVRQAIGETEGVLDLKTKVVNHEDSITVKINMALSADSHIPNVTMMMQRNVKRFIEEFSGIAVREVVVLVSEIREVVSAIPAPREDESAANVKPVYVEPISEPEDAEIAPQREDAVPVAPEGAEEEQRTAPEESAECEEADASEDEAFECGSDLETEEKSGPDHFAD